MRQGNTWDNSQNALPSYNDKLLYIEVLRVLAIIAVIYVHTPLAWSSAENLNCSPWVSWLTLGLRPLFSINVPLFFMR